MRALLTATMLITVATLFAALAVPPSALAQSAPAASSSAAAPASSAPAPAASGSAAASPATDAKKKEEARAHFDKGVTMFEEQAWEAALAEFLRSREIFATRAATTNAAVCLRKLHRFDEALDMFEALLKEFPNLPANDKATAERERTELRGLVGAIEIRSSEPDASAVIDGRERGTARPGQVIRVSAGSHVVKVYKEGFNAFESRVEVSGGQTAIVDARLVALTQSGRLRVSEQGGQSLEVLVDGVAVGKTPWDGQLALGEHTVQLRGTGDVGTQPVSAPIELNHTSVLTLQAEELTAGLRVSPTPIGATVAVDGVIVGRGLWSGKLRAGQHRVEVAAEGFVPVTRQVKIDKGKQESIALELERDPNSALWRAQNPSRFTIELDGAPAIAPSFGGDITSDCTGACAAKLGFGGIFVGRIGYQLGSGLGFSLNAGYLSATQKIVDRAAGVRPQGLPENQGTAADTLKLSGLLVGADAAFHRGTKVPLTFGLGVGVLIGTLNDRRTGNFMTSARMVAPGMPPRMQEAYTVDLETAASAKYLYLDPKVRVGVKLGDHFEVNVGIDAMIFVALAQPKWDSTKPVAAGGLGTGDGLAYFGPQALAGKTIVVLGPGLGARYEF